MCRQYAASEQWAAVVSAMMAVAEKKQSEPPNAASLLADLLRDASSPLSKLDFKTCGRRAA